MEANFLQYPVIKGFKISSSVKSILLTGSSIDSFTYKKSDAKLENKSPVLIEPEFKQQDFLEFSYDLNPLDKLYNKRLILKSKSLRFVYHAITVNNIVYFFRSSESSNQKK